MARTKTKDITDRFKRMRKFWLSGKLGERKLTNWR